MRTATLAFAAGIFWLQHRPVLPGAVVLALCALAGAGLLAAVGPRWRARLPVLGAALLGVAWAGALAQARLGDVLPAALEGRDLEVTGVIAGLPQPFEHGQRFDFDVEQAAAAVPRRLALTWYRGRRAADDDDLHAVPELAAGARWRLTVRLKRPHGNLNPHGFDYEGWLFEQGIGATGYVRRDDANRRLDGLVARPGYLVERLRQQVRERFQRVLGDAPYAGVLVALAIGDQRAIDNGLWPVFTKTGVSHLLSVSGLHVTMVAGLAGSLLGLAWRRVPWLALRLPAQQAGAAAGFAAAFAYCLLAGFAVPAQRTLYMLSVVALALWAGRTAAASRVLAAALLLVLVLDPWAVLAPGFWLSFGAVAVLFLAGAGRLGAGHWLVAWARAQWAVTLGLVPALLALFQQFSLVSPLANAVAIPLVSLVVTPLALVGMLPLADPLLWLAHALLELLVAGLAGLAASPWSVWQQAAPPAWAVVLGLAGVAWLLLPRGFPARWVGAVALMPLVAVPPERPAAGDALVRVLDVGQGLAVHVQTAGHDLLYDAGPAFTADANSGNRIIVPYLRAVGVTRLDALVVSHADKDHEGGAGAVLDALPTRRLVSSLPVAHPLRAGAVPHEICRDGLAWDWDGVRFEVLYPAAGDYGTAAKSNDLSCVLRVAAATGSVLLTGDLEAAREGALLARDPARLAARLVVPPHHGSRSSSSPAFVAAVGAHDAVFSAGYRNRFGHPAAEVADRYRSGGARLHRTDAGGAVTVLLTASGTVVRSERQEHPRYWHGR